MAFDEHGYPTKPRKTNNDDIWFYVQKEGLLVAHANGAATIRWSDVKKALRDHEAATERRP